MTNNQYLKENGFIPNQFGNFVYSKDKHYLNLAYLMKSLISSLRRY